MRYLRVKACAICGTDVEQYRGEMDGIIDLRYPLVPGHEAVGVIDEIGVDATERCDLAVGDRVAVEPFLPCGSCRHCRPARTSPALFDRSRHLAHWTVLRVFPSRLHDVADRREQGHLGLPSECGET